jgi:hypothetical protein
MTRIITTKLYMSISGSIELSYTVSPQESIRGEGGLQVTAELFNSSVALCALCVRVCLKLEHVCEGLSQREELCSLAVTSLGLAC